MVFKGKVILGEVKVGIGLDLNRVEVLVGDL